MDYPFVSIIIPAYNAENFLPVCLDALMRLDYPSDRREIIVVNNNSSDSTEAIIRKYPVRLLQETAVQSAYAARNRGIGSAKGEILAFTDTDCVVATEWLKQLIMKHGDWKIGCFAGNILSYQPASLAEKFADYDDECHNQYRELTAGYMPSANTANVAYRKEAFEKAGFFNAALRWSGDAEFTWRLLKRTDFEISYNPDAVVYHKDRSSLRELYKQHREYGEGIADLLKLYPGSCAETMCFVADIFRFGFRGLRALPRNLYRYYRKDLDKIEVYYDLLKAMCRLGLVVGRVRAQGRREDGRISSLLVTKYLFSKFFIRLKLMITT
jgi:glycosyltransferase involved in cell wall biosynthesis